MFAKLNVVTGFICVAVVVCSWSCLGFGGSGVSQGVTAKEVAVEKRPWLAGSDNPFGRIFGMARSADRAVVVAAARGALSLNLDGEIVRQAGFQDGEDYFPVGVVLESTASTWFLGLSGSPALTEDRAELVVFDRQGERTAAVPVRSTGMFAAGDLIGDAEYEILVAPGNGQDPAVFNQEGERLRELPIDGYTTGLAVADTDGSGDDEAVVFTYPHRDRRGRFHVVDLRAGTSRHWDHEAVGKEFGILRDENGVLRIVVTSKSGFELLSFDGRVVTTLSAPGAGEFRRVRGAWLSDRWLVLTASGGGYVPFHMVCVYRDHKLVYQETGKGRSYALLPLPGAGDEFLVAVEEQVLKVSIKG